MKIIDNIEFSHVKEVVISRKVFYIKVVDNDCYVRDDTRTKQSVIDDNVMPDCLSSGEMANYVRDYVGIKRWKIVFSSGTINIFKKGLKIKKPEEVEEPKSKKSKKIKKNQ